MSYKIDLSGLSRDGEVSLTQQLVERFRRAIDEGELEPGEKLPPTRELAAEVGVNHLTAARVYRKLAELGYVTASVGRGTFVRALAPEASEEFGDDWQVYALPEHAVTYPERVLADAFASAGDPDLISLAVGWPSPAPLSDRRARADRRRRLRGGGRRGALLPAGRGPVRVPRAARAARAPLRLGRRAGRDRGRVGGQAGAQPRRQGDARGGRRRGDRVTHLPRHARVAAPARARV